MKRKHGTFTLHGVSNLIEEHPNVRSIPSCTQFTGKIKENILFYQIN